jgi:hypothetical protein
MFWGNIRILFNICRISFPVGTVSGAWRFSYPSRAESKNGRSYTLPSLHVFILWVGTCLPFRCTFHFSCTIYARTQITATTFASIIHSYWTVISKELFCQIHVGLTGFWHKNSSSPTVCNVLHSGGLHDSKFIPVPRLEKLKRERSSANILEQV